VIKVFAVALIFFVANGFLLAVLNGKKEVKRYVISNIAGSFISLVFVAVLTISSGLYGALISLALYQSISFFATLKVCCGSEWFELSGFFGVVEKKHVSNLLKYALMAITSAVCVPVSHMLVRGYLTDSFSADAAGYWEALWRMSSTYLLLVTTTLSLYYLPRLSELKKYSEIKTEIISGYKIILPVAALCGLAVYLLRDFIVVVLFSHQFLPARELFGWQMVGDTLKIGSWLLAYVMVGKAMFKTFILTEVLAAGCFVLFTVLLTGVYGVEGVAIAHAATYFVYWLMVSLGVFLHFKNKKVG
jgi:PST family polysaccharide transporter